MDFISEYAVGHDGSTFSRRVLCHRCGFSLLSHSL
eukprot:COSAG01_NODE_4156_length_5291_cov_4.177196_9_plen_35_part_00